MTKPALRRVWVHEGLLNDGPARATLAEEAVVCPHVADPENW